MRLPWREHRALRLGRRARRVRDHRQVRRRRSDVAADRRRASGLLQGHGPGRRRAARRSRSPSPGSATSVADLQDARAGTPARSRRPSRRRRPGSKPSSARRQHHVQRAGDRARPHRPVERVDELRHVPGHDRDPVAGRDAQRRQRRGREVQPVVQFRERDRPCPWKTIAAPAGRRVGGVADQRRRRSCVASRPASRRPRPRRGARARRPRAGVRPAHSACVVPRDSNSATSSNAAGARVRTAPAGTRRSPSCGTTARVPSGSSYRARSRSRAGRLDAAGQPVPPVAQVDLPRAQAEVAPAADLRQPDPAAVPQHADRGHERRQDRPRRPWAVSAWTTPWSPSKSPQCAHAHRSACRVPNRCPCCAGASATSYRSPSTVIVPTIRVSTFGEIRLRRRQAPPVHPVREQPVRLGAGGPRQRPGDRRGRRPRDGPRPRRERHASRSPIRTSNRSGRDLHASSLARWMPNVRGRGRTGRTARTTTAARPPGPARVERIQNPWPEARVGEGQEPDLVPVPRARAGQVVAFGSRAEGYPAAPWASGRMAGLPPPVTVDRTDHSTIDR